MKISFTALEKKSTALKLIFMFFLKQNRTLFLNIENSSIILLSILTDIYLNLYSDIN